MVAGEIGNQFQEVFMPSPFPGMDPYLEGNWWTSFRAELAPMIAHQLMPRLRPKYIALPERKYISGSLEDVMISATMIPDVGILKSATFTNVAWSPPSSCS